MNRKNARSNRRYAIGTAASAFLLLALTTTVWAMRPVELDPQTLCPASREIEGHTVVILDRTDPWNPAMGDALQELIENAQRNTAQHQKFSIVSMDERQSPHPLFSICNPGQPTLLSDIYRGRRYTERDFEQRFVGAAESVVEQVRQPSAAPTSPIIEYVHRWLGSDQFNAEVPNRRLVLVSDMRQNSPLFSIYRQNAADDFGALIDAQLGDSAQGVTFDIYFLAHGRDRDVSEDDVRAVWDQAFRNIGADYTWRQIS